MILLIMYTNLNGVLIKRVNGLILEFQITIIMAHRVLIVVRYLIIVGMKIELNMTMYFIAIAQYMLL